MLVHFMEFVINVSFITQRNVEVKYICKLYLFAADCKDCRFLVFRLST